MPKQPKTTKEIAEKTVILVPFLPKQEEAGKGLFSLSKEDRIAEIEGLAKAISLQIISTECFNLEKPQAPTYLGKGQVEKVQEIVKKNDISLVIIDTEISPIQQRNLEKSWQCKVIDRTALILEIFRERAHTKEGALQVELAHLSYQKSRLVRSWTHLERQKGGRGFLGGPGETQIEADRRQLQEKMLRIKTALDKVVKTRQIHRDKRKKSLAPVVALVGYTNAGKSTLFNQLTKASVLAKDMLFATLDPTLRQVSLPLGQKIILSDTVGFISNLPTNLVAAFRATLEEILQADLILHVRDISNIDHNRQAEDVNKVLSSLGVDVENKALLFEIWNKIDILTPHQQDLAHQAAKRHSLKSYIISAKTGQGIEDMLKAIETHLFGQLEQLHLTLKLEELSLLNLVYKFANKVETIAHEDGSLTIEALITTSNKALFYQEIEKSRL